MIELSGVAKRYGDVLAVQRLDLAVPSRETTVLIGPSGCGKSTLLRMMIGLVEPDEGTVRIDGERLTAATQRALRHRIGYVIQRGGLFPHLTARDNVTLLAQHLGWLGDRVDGRLRDLADLVHFPLARLDAYPAQLSGGQQQRVSLMRALMLDPATLLLDEPLGALDPMIRAELQRDLRQIFAELDKTVVLVTHDLGEAAYFADQVVLLQAGAIVQVGPMETLLTAPASSFVEAFVQAQRQTADVWT